MDRTTRRAAWCSLGLLLLLGGYLLAIQLAGNFGTVVDGVVYRSNQPSASQLSAYTQEHGIRSVINLRGAKPGSAWYDEEIVSARSLNLVHYDFPMSDSEELSADRARQLVELMARAEKPLLIHCKAGADRTGLAAALYLAKLAGATEAQAERQISIRYGHISLPVSPAFAMDRSFEAFEPWLGISGS